MNLPPAKLLLIDAMAMAFRSFYAFGPRQLTTSQGHPSSVVLASLQFMLKLLQEQKPDYLLFAVDTKEPTFRHVLSPEYKANRVEMPRELAAQLPDFFRLLEAFGVPVLRLPGFEADDIIGTLARRWASPMLKAYIVSGDKDFMQLIGDHIALLRPKKGDEAQLIDRAGVHEYFGVAPEQVIDCLAIIGDASDNVKGVHGIGEKGAAKLVATYGSLAGIYANLSVIGNAKQREALERDREQVQRAKQLVTIKTDVPLAIELEEARVDLNRATANQALLQLCRDLELKQLVNKIESQLGTPKTDQAPPAGREQTMASEHLSDARPAQAAMPTPRPAASKGDAASFANYHGIHDAAALDHLLGRLAEAPLLAIDTETTGLDIITDKPIGISISLRAGEAYYIPLLPQHRPAQDQDEIVRKLKTALEQSRALKVGHNLKFDLIMLENLGINLPGPFADTMIMDWLIEPSSRQHGLDHCCLTHLNYEKISTKTLMGDDKKRPMAEAPLEDLVRYAAEDADYTLRLYQHLSPIIEGRGLGTIFSEVEMPLVPILAHMEKTGIFVDTDVLLRFSERLAELIKTEEHNVHALAGENFNINSTKKLSDILFNKLKIHEQLGVKGLKKTQSGFSTDESVLSRLSAHPLPNAILNYRGLSKLKSTYVDALPQLLHPKTQRVHGSFHQTGTATGRLSSSDPNLQNIPIRDELGQEIRRAFRAQRHGHVIISADYSQIELRLLAHLAKEEALLKAFAHGDDIHRTTAAKVFGIAPEQVSPEQRAQAKAINFGIIYGMGARRLAQVTNTSVKDAQAFIDRYFATYPRIKTYIDEAIAYAKTHGESRTILGRRRPITGIGSKGLEGSQAQNIAVNSPIQGAAADLIKLAMIRIDGDLKKHGLSTKLISQVHDELLFEAPAAEAERAQTIIAEGMRSAMQLQVPLEVSTGMGDNWLEAH